MPDSLVFLVEVESVLVRSKDGNTLRVVGNEEIRTSLKCFVDLLVFPDCGHQFRNYLCDFLFFTGIIVGVYHSGIPVSQKFLYCTF